MIAVNLPLGKSTRDPVEGADGGVALAEDANDVLGGDDGGFAQVGVLSAVGDIESGTLRALSYPVQSGITLTVPLVDPRLGLTGA